MKALHVLLVAMALAAPLVTVAVDVDTEFMSDEHRKLGDGIFETVLNRMQQVKSAASAYEVVKAIRGQGETRYFTLGAYDKEHTEKVSFGDLVAMSGDFFAVPERAISTGPDLKARLVNFKNNARTFDDESDVRATKTYLKAEREIINKRHSTGLSYPASYVHLVKDLLKRGLMTDFKRLRKYWGDLADTMWRMKQEISNDANYDHLDPWSFDAYAAGHTAAMEEAKKGHLESDAAKKQRHLEKALVMEGISQHFLTDCFSAGHIRTPRRNMLKSCGNTLGSSLNKCMHDEDGLRGLRVKNAIGHEWLSHGDTTLFDPLSNTNRKYATDAGVNGILEVIESFNTGRIRSLNEILPLKFVPKLHGSENHPPLLRGTPDGYAEYRDSPADESKAVYKKFNGKLSCANAYRKLCLFKEATCFDHGGIQYTHANGNCKRTTLLTCGKDGHCKSDEGNPCSGRCLCEREGFNECVCARPAKEAGVHCTEGLAQVTSRF